MLEQEPVMSGQDFQVPIFASASAQQQQVRSVFLERRSQASFRLLPL